jgi:hypothetical protein
VKFLYLAPSGNEAICSVIIIANRVGASINWRTPAPCQADIAAADVYVIARVKQLLQEQGKYVRSIQATSQYFKDGEHESRITAMRQHLGGGLG